jgi:hypothetical protein
MAKPLNIVVCGSLVPDPLQTLEPVQTPQGPGLKNEQMLPSVLDPWAACALYEAAALAKARPGSKVTLVALGPKAKLQQLMMTVAQKVPLDLVAVNAPAGGFTDAKETAAELAKAIKSMQTAPDFIFGGCASASRDAGVTLPAEKSHQADQERQRIAEEGEHRERHDQEGHAGLEVGQHQDKLLDRSAEMRGEEAERGADDG